MRYLATIALASICGLNSFAQTDTHAHCGTDEYFRQRAEAHPELLQMREQSDEQWLESTEAYSEGTESAVHIIPVVVHVMYYNFSDSISIEQIEDAIAVLNEDYSRSNNDAGNVRSVFAARQADMEIEFRLAKIDPNGNATNGVTYQQSDRSLEADDAIKTEVNWPNTKYLNIWTVRDIDLGLPPSQGTILGYAAFPYNNQPTTDDGIVIRHDAMGRIGTSVGNGRTLTHEAGHFFNLYHPFQGGCNGGDLINDTPPVASASYGCNLNRNSCNSGTGDEPDMIENFMDYADDVCANTFTNGQKARAKGALSASNHPQWRRGMLTTSSNLSATGVNSTTASASPTAGFTPAEKVTCVGVPLEFINTSASHLPGTTYNWTFNGPGGQSLSSTQENPSMTFTQAGDYNVTLTVTNAAGTDAVTKNKVIRVHDSQNTLYRNRFTATFEKNIPNETWTVIDNGDDRHWQTSNSASTGGSKSAVIPNFNNKAEDGADILQTTLISLDQTSFATLNFSYAWAPRAGGNQDRLGIYISNNCGDSWQLARLISSFQLNTTGTTVPNSPFIPSAGQWNQESVSLNNYLGPDPIMIRFEYTSGGGNNLYLDEITTSVSIGLDEESALNLSVYPNPADEYINVVFNQNTSAVWTLSNLNGQSMKSGSFSGESRIYVNDLPKGMYLLKVTSDGTTHTEKVMVR